MIKVSPSMLSADFARLGAELKKVEDAGADWVHIDVMDGLFVPNITIGQQVVKALRPLSRLPFDVHLMIVEPARYVSGFAEAGSDLITIHVEADEKVEETLSLIKSLGKKAGLSLNPDTPFSAVQPFMHSIDLLLVMTVQPGFGGQSFREYCLPKIRQAREFIDTHGLDVEIAVDGGINRETGRACVDAGATVLAAGSSLFGQQDMAKEIALWQSFQHGKH
ncbi:MAG: ribulose-phosphate 3-epimerase [Candidatus Methanomethylophilaceae archaeon]